MHLIVSGLSGYEGFVSFLKETKHFDYIKNITLHESYQDAVAKIKYSSYDSLFIEDDRVSLYHLMAPLKRRYLSVFEEGFGTYLGDFPEKLKGLRKLKWNFMSLITGCGIQFGDGRKTDFVLVQYPTLYNKLNPKNARKTLSFPGIIDEIAKDLMAWERILEAEIGEISQNNKNANFIIGTWGGFPPEKIENIRDKNIVTFYKAHPHDGLSSDNEELRVIKHSWIPAEACIGVLSRKYTDLDVYHFSSSAFFYCRGRFENVVFTDLLSNKRFLSVCNQEH